MGSSNVSHSKSDIIYKLAVIKVSSLNICLKIGLSFFWWVLPDTSVTSSNVLTQK